MKKLVKFITVVIGLAIFLSLSSCSSLPDVLNRYSGTGNSSQGTGNSSQSVAPSEPAPEDDIMLHPEK